MRFLAVNQRFSAIFLEYIADYFAGSRFVYLIENYFSIDVTHSTVYDNFKILKSEI